MFEGVVIGLFVGSAVGVVFHKYVISEADAIKKHVSDEIEHLEETLKAKI